MSTVIIYIFLALAFIAIIIIGSQNTIKSLQKNCDNAWQNLQAQLKSRSDILSNLLPIIEKHARQEGVHLIKIADAMAISMEAETFKTKSAAENVLTKSLEIIPNLPNKYPNLNNDPNFQTSFSALNDTQNQVQISIQTYNSAVAEYNTRLTTFPLTFIAKIFKYKSRESFVTISA